MTETTHTGNDGGIIETQADEIYLLRKQLRELAALALSVVSDTTPAGMSSDDERKLREMCVRLLGVHG